jgi:16S rRNA (guanine966-N2)-methyltransferase
MRIIAGSWRGRTLLTPSGRAIRPTSDRAREALFAILEHGRPPLGGARFLDLFCGTGAVGLEAASRGAAEVWLVDREGAGPALAGLAGGWLAPGAAVILELAAREDVDLPEEYLLERERRYGAARFLFLREGA